MIDWWLWLPAGEALWIVGMSIWILSERRPPASTIAWLLVLSFLPVIGVAVYLLVGPRKFRRKTLRHELAHEVAARAGSGVDDRAPTEGLPAPLIRQSEAALGPVARPRRGLLGLSFDGREHFEQLVAAIDAARDHVHLEYYIWEPDRLGRRLRDRLAARAAAGVQVRVLVDGLGSRSAGRRFWAPLVQSGGEVAHFNPLLIRRPRPGYANFRTHRKIAVIDGRVGFTGGMNVDECHSSEFVGAEAWRDTHLRVEGTAVRGLQMVFAEDWYYATGTQLELARCYPDAPAVGPVVQVVASGPDDTKNAIHKLYVGALAGAQTRAWLTTPYFVPDPSLIDALAIAALRGVDVRVLVPARGNHGFVAAASRSYYDELLGPGVRLFEYGPPMLHAKTLAVDDAVSIVGTANIDARSFLLNFEVVVAIFDASATAVLADRFETDLGRAVEVTTEQVEGAGPARRLGRSFARLFSSQL